MVEQSPDHFVGDLKVRRVAGLARPSVPAQESGTSAADEPRPAAVHGSPGLRVGYGVQSVTVDKPRPTATVSAPTAAQASGRAPAIR